MTSSEVTPILTQVIPIDLIIMILALSVKTNHSTTMITMKNLKQSVKAVTVMKVNPTKVKTNMTMIVLQIFLLLTLERCL